MKAIWMTGKGGPEVLELREVEKPLPAAGEVLIRVAAAGLNRADIYTRTSASYGGDTHIPGLEVSGIVESIGPESAGYEGSSPAAAGPAVSPGNQETPFVRSSTAAVMRNMPRYPPGSASRSPQGGAWRRRPACLKRY